MSRPGLLGRVSAWLREASKPSPEVEAWEELQAAKLAGMWPPVARREEPADSARVAAWNSLIKVAERLKREPAPLSVRDARWMGREVARCARALWTTTDRRGIEDTAWAEMGERLRELMADTPRPIDPMLICSHCGAGPVTTTQGGSVAGFHPPLCLPCVEGASPSRCGKPDPNGRACTLLAGHDHPDDHSGKPGPYAVAERLRAKEVADHKAWLRENAASVVLPEHPAVAMLRRIEETSKFCVSCGLGAHATACPIAAILAGSKPGEMAHADLLAEEREAGRQDGYTDSLQKHISERDAVYSAHELGALADELDEDNYATAAKKLRAAIMTIARLEAQVAEERAKGLVFR
jgi:hypothetical protein